MLGFLKDRRSEKIAIYFTVLQFLKPALAVGKVVSVYFNWYCYGFCEGFIKDVKIINKGKLNLKQWIRSK